MTPTMPLIPGCPRFPASTGVLALFFFLAIIPLQLIAQGNPFAENNPGDPAPARQSTLLSDTPEKETNPAVLSILDTNPQTISEMTRTAQQLINLDRRALALVLTLLWELPVAGAGFITGWSGPVIALIAVGVAIWAFGLSLLGSLMADRVNSYATKRWRGRKATGGSQGPVEKDRPAR